MSKKDTDQDGPVKVVAELSRDDMAALYEYIVLMENGDPSGRMRFGIIFGISFAIVMIISSIGHPDDLKNSLMYILAGIALIAIMAVFPGMYHRIMKESNKKDILQQSPEELQIEGQRVFEIKGNTLSISSDYGDLELHGEDIYDFRADKDRIFIKGRRGKGSHVIPVKYFPSEEMKERFLDELAALKADIR